MGILGDLKVISTREERRSVHDSAVWRALAAEVGATQLVQESLQVQDGRLHAVVQLMDAHTEAVLLSRTSSGSLAELFTIESAIARDVAKALGVRVPPDLAEAHVALGNVLWTRPMIFRTPRRSGNSGARPSCSRA